MADTKISNLPAAAALTGAELAVLVQSSADVKATVTSLRGTAVTTGTIAAAIPGMAGSADRSGIGGATISEEYDTSAGGLTWSVAPAVEDSNTTFPSHLYVEVNAIVAETLGTRAYAPGAG